MSLTQAYQDNDPRKYSVATVLVRVLAVNQFYPKFDKVEYQGFVAAGKSPASLVNTYGSKALVLSVHDQDFNQVCSVTCTHATMLIRCSVQSVTHRLVFLQKLTGFQPHDPLHLQFHFQSHRPLSSHTGGAPDRQDQRTQTQTETRSGGEPH